MIRRPPRSTPLYSSAASDVYKRQVWTHRYSCCTHWTDQCLTAPALPAKFVTAWSCSAACPHFQRGQLLRRFKGLQRLDHVVEITVHDAEQFVQREVDAVVGQAALREVVG